MKAEKDKKTGKWLIQYRYTDWQGKRRKSTKKRFCDQKRGGGMASKFPYYAKSGF